MLLTKQQIIDFLSSRGIEYWTEGKNVTYNWVNIRCPFCNDSSNHLGIDPLKNAYNCWRCRASGTLFYLISKLENIPFSQVKDLFRNVIPELPPEIEALPTVDKVKFPRMEKRWPKLHLRYLEKRGFNPDYIIPKYALRAVYLSGKYRFRIIIPIIMNGKVVSFLSRDVSGRSDRKYMNCPNDRSVVPVKNCVYNLDSVGKQMIIVEGATDVWRLGDGAVSLLGMQFTDAQILALKRKFVQRAFILFDSEDLAQELAEKLANILSLYIPTVEVVTIEEEDPAEMNQEDAYKLKAHLFRS